MKNYKVSLKFEQIIEAENEEEAKEEMRNIFDSTFLKLDCEEVKK